MKNLLPISYLFLICLFAGCSSDDDNESLPPETQTGANTVGCLVNGEVFLPHGEGLSPEVNCFYQLVDGEYYFTLALKDLRGGAVKTISIQIGKTELINGNSYILNKNPVDNGDYMGGGGTYRLSAANKYYTNSIQIGELKIARLDLSNSIVSGTFWFDAINEDGEIVEIREGRFDWNY